MKTSIIIPDKLHYKLKVRAAIEKTDVSRLLCRIAAEYLKRKGGR